MTHRPPPPPRLRLGLGKLEFDAQGALVILAALVIALTVIFAAKEAVSATPAPSDAAHHSRCCAVSMGWAINETQPEVGTSSCVKGERTNWFRGQACAL